MLDHCLLIKNNAKFETIQGYFLILLLIILTPCFIRNEYEKVNIISKIFYLSYNRLKAKIENIILRSNLTKNGVIIK